MTTPTDEMKTYIFQVEIQASSEDDARDILGGGERGLTHQWIGSRLDCVLDDDGEEIWENPEIYGVSE
jgi:hypothetical protein